ncbi:hypothetical protein WB66_23620 [bacteria symbiont BFo1 of Frankliniella occidentalis]|nr:hypothetical protein AI28_24215 [bacteria symbiont BFo1 of Frankliniella occidentalis]KYP82388.1 hypothetical protein WB66_23620 [bacteria symbiont BFo1 of Frankliniella occidentalis]KYP87051.1 hypothetical protein WB91_22370 [bacteria symbiont BFo1 of Frankliniella occidentalis]
MRLTINQIAGFSVRHGFDFRKMRLSIEIIFVAVIGVHQKCFKFLRDGGKRFLRHLILFK